MTKTLTSRSSRPVAIWLLIGVAMLIIQVLLGGITRLTGSGLSITEWKPIMGALPPMNEKDWNTAFEQYKQIAQFKYLNSHFTLHDFKFIFFWEWFHRLWARLMAVVFMIPFIVFLVQKRFKKEMVKPMIILFLLGGLQGLVGWIMVKSGLEDSDALYVSHYKLAIHFILALGLLCYTLWFALELQISKEKLFSNPVLKKFTIWIIAILVVQLIYGAFMAGLKAAAAAPTWPDINGVWFPEQVHSFGGHHFSGLSFLTDNPLMMHFIHRNLAYLVTILVFVWWWKARKKSVNTLFRRTCLLPAGLILIQVLLGICVILNVSDKDDFLWLGIAHQFVAMLLLLSFILNIFFIRKKINPD